MKNKFNYNLSLSKITVIVVSLYILFFHFTLPKYTFDHYSREVSWDILSYYLYLPLSFIEHDIGLNNSSYSTLLIDKYQFSTSFYQAAPAPNGNLVMIYTMGMSFLYLPFFLIGHLWATLGGYPTDGFSFPYQFCVATGMMIYVILGIIFLRKILLCFFSERIASIVILVIALGTNYFREATDYNMGPHITLFLFYTVLIYYTIKWHENQKIKYSVIIGISIGMLILIRPTEAICIFIPVLWNIYNKESFKMKIQLIKHNYRQLFYLLICVVMVGLPQMIYWKFQTGSFVYNSYWNQHSFDISTSHFLDVFFSIRKGWLIYTPLIFFSFVGLFFLGKGALKKARLPILTFFLLNVFILTHIPIWWNAGSFGQRFMVQSYAILSLPMGAFFQHISNRNNFYKGIIGIVSISLILLNIFQTWQFVRWIIPGDGMTWEYYKYSFFKTSYMTKEEQSLLMLQRTFDPNEKFNESNPQYKRRTIAYYNMDDINSQEIDRIYLDTTFAKSGKHSYVLSDQNEFSLVFETSYSNITKKDHLWIKLTVWYFSTEKLESSPADIVIHMNHNGEAYQYFGYPIDTSEYRINEWNKFSAYYLTPYIQDEEDKIISYLWFRGKKKIYIDDFQIEVFERR